MRVRKFVITNYIRIYEQKERVKMERSSKILSGINNQYYRATMKSMGFSTNDLKKPIIGIANAWSECVPGHYNLRQVAQRVKDGIYQAGGTPVEFGVIGGCDGMGQGHDGMHYILPSRELIANSIESMAQINLFDGLVLLLVGADFKLFSRFFVDVNGTVHRKLFNTGRQRNRAVNFGSGALGGFNDLLGGAVDGAVVECAESNADFWTLHGRAVYWLYFKGLFI